MFQLLEQLHLISTKNNLKLAPEKTFFMILNVKFLGHENGYNTIKPIYSKIAAIRKIPFTAGKVALKKFIDAHNFHSKFIEKLHFNFKPFYDLLHEKTPRKWTDEHESQKLKMSFTPETKLTIANSKHPFFITVDGSLIGLGRRCFFQLNEENEMKVISFNSRILNPQEQELSTLDQELPGIVHALQIDDFSSLVLHIQYMSSLMINFFFIVLQKSNLSPQSFQNSKSFILLEKVCVADMLSRSFTKDELQINQLKHKQLPPQIDFAIAQDSTLKPVHYVIIHEEVLPHQTHDSHPILPDFGTAQFSIRINDKGNDINVKLLHSISFISETLFQTKF